MDVSTSETTRRPTPCDTAAPVHAFTIDVEDYFHAHALASAIDRADWDDWPLRVIDSTHRLLDLLARKNVRATFFTLGWVADKAPTLMRRIVENGHELACHGHLHHRVDHLKPYEFSEDLRRAQRQLEDHTGVAVHGYRAPSFSISDRTPWAYDTLASLGFRYSSSVHPIQHDHYGDPNAPTVAHFPHSDVLEIPISTLRLGGANRAFAGGGHFRLLPYRVSRHAWRVYQRHRAEPGVFYIHPWEIDPDQPRPARLPLRVRMRHYLNLTRTEQRLDRLLGDFRWDRMDRLFLSQR
ncbi:MAG: XrtA system polysaccharide deacetylase [Geminicoccaceae bacterium]